MADASEQAAQGRSGGKPRELEAVRTTIVGGRPPGSGRQWGDIPRGIEVLVKKASIDPEFRRLLLEKRAEAAGEIDLALDPAEVTMLAHAPRAQLEAIIAGTHVDMESRAAFLGRAAAVMLAALGAGPLAAAGTEEQSKTDAAQAKGDKTARKPDEKAQEKPPETNKKKAAAKSPEAKANQEQRQLKKKKKRPTARETAAKKLERPTDPPPSRGIEPLGIRPEPTGVRRWRDYK